ncbi:MAG: glycosyltransferase, partial [Bacteroidota bacterium]|nr:glycosyltransferase [Bacteroidota bacterium]
MADTSSVNISIVIPLLNEEESLRELMEWIHNSLSSDFTYEVLFIDDGSTDTSWQIIG